MKVKQLLAGALICALCGAPQLIEAQQSQSSGASSTAVQPEAQPAAPASQASPQSSAPPSAVNGVSVDPARGPLQPVPAEPAAQAQTDSSSQAQPQTGQTAAQTQTQTRTQTQSNDLPQNPEPQTPSEPVGAATAQQGPTAGGAASKPAGTAIAPAKQRQVRSWLIRVGAIAAAGAALGTVFALSRRTPSTPPGAQTLGVH